MTTELKSSKKGLINIRNKKKKCFLWCHVRYINSVKIHPGSITQNDKKLVNDLNYFPIREKDFSKIKTKSNICINVYYYENKVTFPIYVLRSKI